MRPKQLVWIGSSKKDLLMLSDEVREVIGYALYLAQLGQKHKIAKPLKGFGGAGVLEIVDEDRYGTYRAVYTVTFKEMVFVLHVFQKKSKQGIKTPKQEIELIKNRLKEAQEIFEELLNK